MSALFNQRIFTGAVGLGIGLACAIAVLPRVAVGYPTAAVSSGTNPVVSAGGTMSVSTTDTVLSASGDQDLVVTDIVLGVTNTYGYYCEGNFQVTASSAGATLGQFVVAHPEIERVQLRNEVISLKSGLRIPAGQSLSLHFSTAWRDCGDFHTLNYTVSGYHAQP